MKFPISPPNSIYNLEEIWNTIWDFVKSSISNPYTMKTSNLAFENAIDDTINLCCQDEIRNLDKSNFYRAFGNSYPNLQFSCPNCGTLDVLINLENSQIIFGKCLDCSTNWKEEYSF